MNGIMLNTKGWTLPIDLFRYQPEKLARCRNMSTRMRPAA
jgi:hypothetical protein